MKEIRHGFTKEEIKLLKHYLKKGMKMKDICKAFDCGDARVRSAMHKNKLVHHCHIYKEKSIPLVITVKRKYYLEALKVLNKAAQRFK